VAVLFLEEVPGSKIHNKKCYKHRQKEYHSYKAETWNIKTLKKERPMGEF
jgi:hypothetical protein